MTDQATQVAGADSPEIGPGGAVRISVGAWSAIRWAFRACLLLLLITPFLPWFSMWTPEGWGDHADHFGISAGLMVLILLPTLIALAAAFTEAVFPIAGLFSVLAAIASFLAVLLAILAGQPSLKQFQDVPDVGNTIASTIQIQLVGGAWIALVLSIAAVTLGIILNRQVLLRVLNLEKWAAKANYKMEAASFHSDVGIVVGEVGRVSQPTITREQGVRAIAMNDNVGNSGEAPRKRAALKPPIRWAYWGCLLFLLITQFFPPASRTTRSAAGVTVQTLGSVSKQ